MDPVLPFLVKVLSGLAALAKSEVGTLVGKINLLLTAILVILIYLLGDKLLSQSTLEWAVAAGVGGAVLTTLIVILVLPSLMVLASLFLVYKEVSGKK